MLLVSFEHHQSLLVRFKLLSVIYLYIFAIYGIEFDKIHKLLLLSYKHNFFLKSSIKRYEKIFIWKLFCCYLKGKKTYVCLNSTKDYFHLSLLNVFFNKFTSIFLMHNSYLFFLFAASKSIHFYNDHNMLIFWKMMFNFVEANNILLDKEF